VNSDWRTEIWNGEVEYHTYKQRGWLGIGGIDHPMFKLMQSRILSESKYISEYKLYVVGGLLEDWVSWDVDFAVIGEYDPIKIKEIFETITKISFEIRLFADCHYQKELWPIHLYSKYDCSLIVIIKRNYGQFTYILNMVVMTRYTIVYDYLIYLLKMVNIKI